MENIQVLNPVTEKRYILGSIYLILGWFINLILWLTFALADEVAFIGMSGFFGLILAYTHFGIMSYAEGKNRAHHGWLALVSLIDGIIIIYTALELSKIY
jgi:hypothetical protein